MLGRGFSHLWVFSIQRLFRIKEYVKEPEAYFRACLHRFLSPRHVFIQ